MTERYWRAICTECGATGKTADNARWLSPFFCPDRCPACGATKRQYADPFEDAGWRLSYGYWRPNPRPVAFNLLRPQTWFFPYSETWIDADNERAGRAALAEVKP